MSKDKYPWRQHNHFTLLRDGECFYPVIFEHFAQARDFILIEMYLISSGNVTQQLIDALQLAASRGVSIYLLFDDYGARGLNKQDRATLKSLGAKLCFYNRLHLRHPLHYLPRDHRKIICIDKDVVFVGGLGFHDCFLHNHPEQSWRETVVQIRGELCQDWIDTFCLTWKETTQRTLHLLSAPRVLEHYAQPGHVALSPYQHQREVRRNIIKQLRRAKQRIWLSTAYFVPSRKIRRLLRHAARRGVDVRIILPGASIDHAGVRFAARRFYTRLLHSNVKIYEYQPRFIHHKVMLIDDWVSIGSANLDRWNLRWNLEANQEVFCPSFAQDVANMLEQDMQHCLQLTFFQWCQRSRWGRLQEWFWGKVDILLLKLGRMHNPR